jgi:hypothetical protein
MVDFNFRQRDRLAQICRFFHICQTFFYFFTPIHSYPLRFTPIHSDFLEPLAGLARDFSLLASNP